MCVDIEGKTVTEIDRLKALGINKDTFNPATERNVDTLEKR
jgi:hypothetical protein